MSGVEKWMRACLAPSLLLAFAMPLALIVASSASRVVARAEELRDRSPVGSLVVGLFDVAVVIGLRAALSGPIGNVVVLVFGAMLLLALVVGLIGTARSVGARVVALGSTPVTGLRSLVWGWAIVASLPLLPLAGTLMALYFGLGAIGSGVLAFVVHGPASTPNEEGA